ncbi:phosphoinositide phospholipase C 2-like isoform X1 [Oryza glaberrima]|uniref:phosphoinositide phospholipase C 2-like isoform X1 n=2 Tax=Oryza glaberrima TaxID=4538 RepID=UPI00023E278D|nr:phosphoinositide phospholipase C 2-like isoform X1 [Oryza glaberrima]
MTTYRVCCFLRRFRAASNEPSEELGDVFQAYADGGGGVMGEEALRRFLREVQGEAAGGGDDELEATAREVMAFAAEQRLLRKGGAAAAGGGLTVEGFHRWLCSDANAALDPQKRVYQDMGLPLSHYFIYTGHNSYLTGNQLSSGCSEVPIVKALHDGVRVIELDLWPNAAKDAVEVLHGRTLTSPVGLMKCLEAIREHAFVASPYPVILTLEDHLTPDLQSKVAKMIKETFGDMLYVSETENMAEFPSPDELKGKIIVSTKPPKEYLQTKNDADADEAGVWGEEITDDKVAATAMTTEEKCAAAEEAVAAAAVDEEMQEAETDKKTQHGVDNEYRRLIAIPLTRRKHDMDQDLKVDPDMVTRLSLGEKAYEKAIVTHGAHIIRFTQWNLLRIFPRSTRITSSNYNPLMGWRYGVQMVAANMQGHGRKLWLTQGMFRANGGCGYVKKPDILMNNDPDKLFDPTSKLPVKTRLKVTVYMGDGWRFDFRKTHFDKCSPPDFYARVGIAGVEADTRMEQTKVKMDTWIPAWDHEFEFPLSVPELALLRVEVHESDNHQKDDFGGQTCLPVWELRRGIRSVRLCDHRGEPLRSVKLLMRFDFT